MIGQLLTSLSIDDTNSIIFRIIQILSQKGFKMSIEIFYFTGTGNSLAVARQIAQKTNARLTGIPSVIAQPSISTDAKAVGIVFPCYMAQLFGVPLMVERFIEKLRGLDCKYVFGVCTCGGLISFNGLPTIKNLAKAIKRAGGSLAAAYTVKMPMNNLDYDLPFPVDQDQENMFRVCHQQTDSISARVLQRKKSRHRIPKAVLSLLMTPMYGLMKNAYIKALKQYAKEPQNSKLKYEKLIFLSDRSISVDDKCTGCGICESVCPAQNIRMSGGKPEWVHRCEMCAACVEWCPQKAIHHWFRAEGIEYRHPNVRISDMIKQNHYEIK